VLAVRTSKKMKFGKMLRQRMHVPWETKYIKYKYLKTIIKELKDKMDDATALKEEKDKLTKVFFDTGM
jgi:SPX domain protein involved in polyphosphate accumulation